jgi:hypothetical protein
MQLLRTNRKQLPIDSERCSRGHNCLDHSMLYVVLVVAGDSGQNNCRTRLSYHIEKSGPSALRLALVRGGWWRVCGSISRWCSCSVPNGRRVPTLSGLAATRCRVHISSAGERTIIILSSHPIGFECSCVIRPDDCTWFLLRSGHRFGSLGGWQLSQRRT